MFYYPTQKDIEILKFTEKTILAKVVLLNQSFRSLYEFNTEYISGDISIDTDSDIRNTLSLNLLVKDDSISFQEDKKLWIDKFVKVYVGIDSPLVDEPLWYDKGIFVMTDYSFDSINRTINIKCSDLVCTLNGDVGGALEGLTTVIYEADEFTIRQAIIDTLTDLTPFTKYYVEDMPKLIPYDLEFSAGDNVWTILTKLRDLYPGYEMFFDSDGTFICRKKATKISDPILLDDTILQNLYITETENGVLKDIRNTTKVWGKCLETDYYTESCTYDYSTNTYSAHFIGIALNTDGSLPTSAKFAVKMNITNTANGAKLAIYNKPTSDGSETLVTTYDIVDSLEEPITANFFIADRSFVFRYRRDNMYVLGQWQIVAVNKIRNTTPTTAEKNADIVKHGCDDITYTVIPDSPFAVEKIGERLKVCSGGEYSDIQAIDDCITRAEYETWKSAKVVYTISMDMIYIPWLQGNEKVRFTLQETGEQKDWIISQISTSMNSGTMSVSMYEFEPLYNFDVED